MSRRSHPSALAAKAPPPPFDPGATTPGTPSSPLPHSSARIAAATPGTTFAPDDVAASRFRIASLVARGGMGEVYEAEDLVLRTPIALKTIRPEIAADPEAVADLKRELKLARQITHPNVCRVFDFWEDPDAGVFVTMEFLRGETLAARLARAGRLTPSEALPIVEQMAAGLGAAHRAGVVHRDFKSGNVLLEPAHEGEPPRVVITDFGIALAHEAGQDPAALVERERWLGTPDYMAPEQVAGETITPATDLYALGMVMYEMVTGSTAFSGDTTAEIATRRLRESPPSPRVAAPDLDPRWEAAILRCLARNPGDRFPSAEAVLDALVGRDGRRRRRTVAILGFANRSGKPEAAWLSTALAELLTADLAAGDGLHVLPAEEVTRAVASPETRDRERLAQALGVDLVIEGDYEESAPAGAPAALQWQLTLRAATGELLATIDATAVGNELIQLAERAGLEIRRSLNLDPLSPAELRRARAGFPASATTLRLYAEALSRLRMFDELGAVTLLEAAIDADASFPLVHAALADAWAKLGHDARAAEAGRRAFELSGGLAREERLLVEARYRELAGNHQRAIDIYRALRVFYPDRIEYGLRLIAAEVETRAAGDALATVEALRALPPPVGDDPRLDIAEAQAALASSDLLRAQAAAARAGAKGEARGAQWITGRARSVESRVLRAMGDLVAATAATDEARRIQLAAGNRGGATHELLNLSVLLRDQGELARARALLKEALPIMQEIGNRKGTANALTALGSILQDLGDPAHAMTLHEQALGIWREIGNPKGVQLSLNNIGSLLWQRGDLRGAQHKFEEALGMARAQGDRRDEAFFLNNIASMLADQGRLSEAQRSYEVALAIWREVGDRIGIAWGVKTLAGILAVLDQLGAAAHLLEEGVELLRSIGEARTLPDMLSSLAHVHLRQGDVARARLEAEEALSEARTSGYQGNIADGLHRLGMVLLAAGDLDAARAALEEALVVKRAIKETTTIATTEVALAEVMLADGVPAEAAELATRAATDYRTRRQDDETGFALATLARAQIALGELVAAERAIVEAGALLGSSENRLVRRAVALANGCVQGALGRDTEAERLLASVLSEAEAAGHAEHAMLARLALGELQLRTGRETSGLAQLAALEREARERGLVLVARRAAAAAAAAARAGRGEGA